MQPIKQRSRLVRRTGQPHTRVDFAHPSEREFARFLDFYRIRWAYEPTSFPLTWNEGRVSEMFTPDFYLPEHDLYVELTTMRQSLVTPKNRKVRLLRELYPDIRVQLFYRKDYISLLSRHGYQYSEIQNLRRSEIDQILFSPLEVQQRVQSLGRRISRDHRGQAVVLVGVLKGITFFLADLARSIKVPTAFDYISIAPYDPSVEGERARFSKDLDKSIEGRRVVLVEDIINTGVTTDFILRSLGQRQPATLEVATLVDRPSRRIVSVPLKYVGFQIPADYVVGYGLDYHELYRNLPFLATLKPQVYEPTSAQVEQTLRVL